MLTYEQAQELQEHIQSEAPQVVAEIVTEKVSPSAYYLVIIHQQQPRFVVRSLQQWHERKQTLHP